MWTKKFAFALFAGTLVLIIITILSNDNSFRFIVVSALVMVWVVMFGKQHVPNTINHLKAYRGATTAEAENFKPDRYFRLKRRRGWREVVIEIDDTIEMPNSEIVPIQLTNNLNFCGSQDILWADGVLFEYRGRIFYGNIRWRK